MRGGGFKYVSNYNGTSKDNVLGFVFYNRTRRCKACEVPFFSFFKERKHKNEKLESGVFRAAADRERSMHFVFCMINFLPNVTVIT